jgi:hypothetical protein
MQYNPVYPRMLEEYKQDYARDKRGPKCIRIQNLNPGILKPRKLLFLTCGTRSQSKGKF